MKDFPLWLVVAAAATFLVIRQQLLAKQPTTVTLPGGERVTAHVKPMERVPVGPRFQLPATLPRMRTTPPFMPTANAWGVGGASGSF